eukprot:COSAG03_NODE_16551_length_398_cov_1.026756_1_plen_81_part_01
MGKSWIRYGIWQLANWRKLYARYGLSILETETTINLTVCLAYRRGHHTYGIDYYAKPGVGGPRWQDQHPVYSDEQLNTPPP